MTRMTRKKDAINRLQDAKDGYKEYLTDEAIDIAIEAIDKCDKIEKIIDSNDADFIADYVRGLFA